MDSVIRNKIFLENEELIQNTIRRHWPMIRALHLERDDVYQELAMAALVAIETFDDCQSNNIRTHVWMQLQDAILRLKQQCCSDILPLRYQWRETIVPPECPTESGVTFGKEHPTEDTLSPELKKALSKLEPGEREAVIRYLNSGTPHRKTQIRNLNAAFDKLRVYYVETHCILGGAL